MPAALYFISDKRIWNFIWLKLGDIFEEFCKINFPKDNCSFKLAISSGGWLDKDRSRETGNGPHQQRS